MTLILKVAEGVSLESGLGLIFKSPSYVIEIISPSDPKPNELADQLKKTIKNGKVIYKRQPIRQLQKDDSRKRRSNIHFYDQI